jgi:hypothetical protein
MIRELLAQGQIFTGNEWSDDYDFTGEYLSWMYQHSTNPEFKASLLGETLKLLREEAAKQYEPLCVPNATVLRYVNGDGGPDFYPALRAQEPHLVRYLDQYGTLTNALATAAEMLAVASKERHLDLPEFAPIRERLPDILAEVVDAPSLKGSFPYLPNARVIAKIPIVAEIPDQRDRFLQEALRALEPTTPTQ